MPAHQPLNWTVLLYSTLNSVTGMTSFISESCFADGLVVAYSGSYRRRREIRSLSYL